MKRPIRSGLGARGFRGARRTLVRAELASMISNGQPRNNSGGDIGAQRTVVARLFQKAAWTTARFSRPGPGDARDSAPPCAPPALASAVLYYVSGMT